MKKHRSIRPVTELRYWTLFQLTNGSFKVPVKERTVEQRRAILQFCRARDQFTVEDGILYRLGKRVLISNEIPMLVDKTVKEINGRGSRALNSEIQRNYTGVSQSRILEALKKNKGSQNTLAKNANTATLEQKEANRVGECWEIDLLEMEDSSVVWKGKLNKFILTILDVHSRYLITEPLRAKRSSEVANAIQGLIQQHGIPKIIHCHNGTEFKGNFQTLAEKQKITVVRSSWTCNPQSQGKFQRSHSLFTRKLQSMALKYSMNWVQLLQRATHAVNTTCLEDLDYKTPRQMYFGRTCKDELTENGTECKVSQQHGVQEEMDCGDADDQDSPITPVLENSSHEPIVLEGDEC